MHHGVVYTKVFYNFAGTMPNHRKQGSQCEKPEHACTPDQFIDPATGYKYATCGE